MAGRQLKQPIRFIATHKCFTWEQTNFLDKRHPVALVLRALQSNTMTQA